jgi:hypothetical protein
MQAQFTAPDPSISLAIYAASCGFLTFNWQQQITNLPGPSPFRPLNPAAITLNFPQNLAGDGSLMATPDFPLPDPPPGSYTYQHDNSFPSYPFYGSEREFGEGIG